MTSAAKRATRRKSQRGISAVNAAIAFALGGTLCAIAIPTFVRQLHASRFAEPVSGLEKMSAAAVAYAQDRPASEAFPESAPLTPAAPPRGTREPDPPGAWDAPGWQALQFRAVPEGEPHSFSFAFDTTHVPGLSTFVAHAHGDLNGNGITSTFEMRGRSSADDAEGALVEQGMYVQDEVE
jgi:hypothetical protein